MANTVSKKSNEPFTTQARQHGTTAENVRQMVGQGDMCHGSLEGSMMGSCMSEVMPLYTEWWQLFKQHLSNHANQHEKLASDLNQTASTFDATDTKTEQIVNDATD
jgi:hypothetical protein